MRKKTFVLHFPNTGGLIHQLPQILRMISSCSLKAKTLSMFCFFKCLCFSLIFRDCVETTMFLTEEKMTERVRALRL